MHVHLKKKEVYIAQNIKHTEFYPILCTREVLKKKRLTHIKIIAEILHFCKICNIAPPPRHPPPPQDKRHMFIYGLIGGQPN